MYYTEFLSVHQSVQNKGSNREIHKRSKQSGFHQTSNLGINGNNLFY